MSSLLALGLIDGTGKRWAGPLLILVVSHGQFVLVSCFPAMLYALVLVPETLTHMAARLPGFLN